MTVGASGAFPLAFLAAFNPGDRVAMAAPFYPPYVNILTALGMQPVILEAGPEARFQPTIAMLEQLDELPDGGKGIRLFQLDDELDWLEADKLAVFHGGSDFLSLACCQP